MAEAAAQAKRPLVISHTGARALTDHVRNTGDDTIKAGIAAPGEGVDVYPMVEAYNSVDRYRRFADDLRKRGWSEARLEKLMGGNFLRVYRDAWGA